ncbi:MAG: hypothetical protein WDN75_18740 [Bacteroidota bacterium]
MNTPIRIAIAEDNSFALNVILEKLKTMPHIAVGFTASNGQDLLEKAGFFRKDRPYPHGHRNAGTQRD